MVTRKEISDAIDRVSKKLVDEGRGIEAGFAAYLVVVWGIDAPKSMPNDQLVALRKAYFSGAQHLWATVMAVMDPGEEPTEADLKRMDQIDRELAQWHATMVSDHVPTEGSA